MMASSYNTTLKFSELFQTKHSVVWFEGCLARCLIFLQLWQRDCKHLGLKISRCGPVVLPIWCMFGLKSVDTNHLFKLKARRDFFCLVNFCVEKLLKTKMRQDVNKKKTKKNTMTSHPKHLCFVWKRDQLNLKWRHAVLSCNANLY